MNRPTPRLTYRRLAPLRILGGLMLLSCTLAAHAGLGNIAQEWLKLGKFKETVATPVATLHVHGDIWGLAFSPDGRLLAASAPLTAHIQLWDWRHHRLLRRFRKVASDLTSTTPLAFSPNGQLLASCTSGSLTAAVRIWNVQTGAVVRDLPGPGQISNCDAVAFTPDGRSLVRVSEQMVRPGNTLMVYSTRTWQPRWGLQTQPFHPSTLALSPHGRWAVLGGYRPDQNPLLAEHEQLLVLDLQRHTVVRTIPTFPPPPREFINGTLVTVSSGLAHAVVWRPGSSVVALGQFGAAPGLGNLIRLYDVQTGALKAQESGAPGIRVYALTYSADGRYLVESGLYRHHAQVIEIWDGAHQHLLQKISGSAGALAAAPDGHYLAMGAGNKIMVWRLK